MATTKDRSALQVAGMLSAGVLGAAELTERTLTAIAACPDQAMFTATTPHRARAEATAAEQRHRAGRPRGLLDGVPVAWKDLFDITGTVTTAGSRLLAAMPPAAEDAPVVARLAAAGMVCVGRTNMTEFAYSGLGLNPHYGTPHNPFGRDEPRVPGGSSSGSAVAVARGLVPVAIGSDTGGSVRVPAAFNGIIGYKASGGRYPMAGVFPLSRTLDTLGVFARTVLDAILVDAAMQGLPAPVVRHRGIGALTVIVPENRIFEGADAAVVTNFDAALDRLRAAGAAIMRRPMPLLDEIVALTECYGTIGAAEAYALHRQRVESDAADLMDQRVVRRMRLAASIAMTDYATLLQERRRLIETDAAHWDGRAIVAMPTVPHTAPAIAPLEADPGLFAEVNMKTLRNTMFGNFLDWCGVSIPTGSDRLGLPTALLLSARPGDDDWLLGVALDAEDAIRGESASP